MKEITEACAFIESKGVINPQIGVVLGTGLGNTFVDTIENPGIYGE